MLTLSVLRLARRQDAESLRRGGRRRRRRRPDRDRHVRLGAGLDVGRREARRSHHGGRGLRAGDGRTGPSPGGVFHNTSFSLYLTICPIS